MSNEILQPLTLGKMMLSGSQPGMTLDAQCHIHTQKAFEKKKNDRETGAGDTQSACKAANPKYPHERTSSAPAEQKLEKPLYGSTQVPA